MEFLKMIKIIVNEFLAKTSIERVPETELIMNSLENVEAFDKAGSDVGPISSVYLLISSQATQVINGSKNVLDLGCGSGQLLTRIAKANPNVHFTGVDLSQNMLDRAAKHIQENSITNVQLQTQDMTQLKSFADHSFDIVTSSLAFHHLPDEIALENCFKEIKRVLKPNGKVFLFDYSLLKKIETIDYFLERGGLDHPKAFIDDTFYSMRAAFPLNLYKNLINKYLPQNVECKTTLLCPFLMLIKSEQEPLSFEQKKHFKIIKNSLSEFNKKNYKDLAFLFRTNGLKGLI